MHGWDSWSALSFTPILQEMLNEEHNVPGPGPLSAMPRCSADRGMWKKKSWAMHFGLLLKKKIIIGPLVPLVNSFYLGQAGWWRSPGQFWEQTPLSFHVRGHFICSDRNCSMATSEALPIYLFIHICHGCIVWEWLFYIFASFCMWGPTLVQPCPIRAPVLSVQMCYIWSTSGRLGSKKWKKLLGFQNTSKCTASLLLLSLTTLIPCAQIGGINFLDLPFFRQDKSSAVSLLAYFCH